MNIIKYYYYWYTGLLRLRFGFCPNCNSSPPDRYCFVCAGDNDYWRGNPNWTAAKGCKWREIYRKGLEAAYR